MQHIPALSSQEISEMEAKKGGLTLTSFWKWREIFVDSHEKEYFQVAENWVLSFLHNAPFLESLIIVFLQKGY